MAHAPDADVDDVFDTFIIDERNSACILKEGSHGDNFATFLWIKLTDQPIYETITRDADGGRMTLIIPYQTFRRNQQKDWLAAAISAAKADFDPELYEPGVIQKMVWKRFRAAREHCREATARRQEEERLAREAELRRVREEAARKRREKEEEQYRTLGNGDVELGRKRFEERMRRQIHAKTTRVHDHTFEERQEFLNWKRQNPDWDTFGDEGMPEKFSCVGSGSNDDGRYNYHYVPKGTLWGILLDLVGFSRIYEFKVSIHVRWNQDFDNYPRIGSYTTVGGRKDPEWCPLLGNDRLGGEAVWRITSAMNLGSDQVIALTENMRVRKVLPKKYAKFGHLVHERMFAVRKCVKLPTRHEIQAIMISNSSKKVMVSTRRSAAQDANPIGSILRTLRENTITSRSESACACSYSE